MLIKFAAFRGPWLLRPLPKYRKILPTAANNQISGSSEYHPHEIKERNKILMLFQSNFLCSFFPEMKSANYSLYAVSNHTGSTYGGHYTAYCKHPIGKDWHSFNDSRWESLFFLPAYYDYDNNNYYLF